MPHNLTFMTGATGVLGRSLSRKLLRTDECPDRAPGPREDRASHSDRGQKDASPRLGSTPIWAPASM